MAAHRWWRINLLTGTQSVTGLLNLEMTDTFGGTTVLGSGTATAQTDQGSPHDPPAALAGSGTYWGSTGAAPQWWQYDFGLGNAFDIQQISWGTNYGDGLTVDMATSWKLSWSDDGTTWTDVITFTPVAWEDGHKQYFFVTANTNRFIWRIECEAGAQSPIFALSEVGMATSMGGSNEIGSGLATALSQQATSGNTSALAASDGNLATFWGSEGSSFTPWWQYDFGPGNNFNIIEVTITPGSGLQSYHPTSFKLKYSTDGNTFTDVQTFTAAAWVASVPQVFDVAQTATQTFMSVGLI